MIATPHLMMRIPTKINKFRLHLVYILIALLLTACRHNAIGLPSRIKSANEIAIAHNFSKRTVKAGDFVFTVFERIIDHENLPFAFYLEKDGYAFTRNGPSDNPTPIKQMLFKLATLDTHRNVVFIARPCQYTDFNLDCNCQTNIYWTKKRLSEEVVSSVNKLIMSYRSPKPFSLIGHSGGGALAILVATRNNNVKDITTIAANLDLDSFNAFHHVEGSMDGSLNPIHYADRLNHIPQLHLVGNRDETVPPFIVQKYINATKSRNVRIKTIPNATHNDGWQNTWKALLSTRL